MGNGSRKYHRETKESPEKQPSEGKVRRWKLDFCPCPRSDEEIGGEWTTEEHENKYQHLTNVRDSVWARPDSLHLLFCRCCVKICIFVVLRAKRMILCISLLAS